jgi:hypothetical protein
MMCEHDILKDGMILGYDPNEPMEVKTTGNDNEILRYPDGRPFLVDRDYKAGESILVPIECIPRGWLLEKMR